MIESLRSRVNGWLLALCALGTGDMLFTAWGLQSGKLGELNPILNWAYSSHGVPGFIALKTFLLIVCALVLGYGVERDKKNVIYTKIGLACYAIGLAIGISVQL